MMCASGAEALRVFVLANNPAVVLVGDEVSLGVVVVVDAGLAGVEVRWWDPFGAAVAAFSRRPAAGCDAAVIAAAGQGFVGDIGLFRRWPSQRCGGEPRCDTPARCSRGMCSPGLWNNRLGCALMKPARQSFCPDGRSL